MALGSRGGRGAVGRLERPGSEKTDACAGERGAVARHAGRGGGGRPGHETDVPGGPHDAGHRNRREVGRRGVVEGPGAEGLHGLADVQRVEPAGTGRGPHGSAGALQRRGNLRRRQGIPGPEDDLHQDPGERVATAGPRLGERRGAVGQQRLGRDRGGHRPRAHAVQLLRLSHQPGGGEAEGVYAPGASERRAL